MKLGTIILMMMTAFTQCGCAPDSYLPPPPNQYGSIGSRITVTGLPSSMPVDSDSITLAGECIEIFGSHSIEWTLNPGNFSGRFINPCLGTSYSVELDVSGGTVVEGTAQLSVSLVVGGRRVDTESVSIEFTSAGSTDIECPGGGTHAYQGLAPDTIRNRARQAAIDVNNQYPGLINQACPAKRGSGNNDFLYRVVQKLRQGPDGARWGLNGKRGNAGDMSEDVVDYYWGSASDPNLKLETYILDVIVACDGPSPSPGATDVTLPDVCGRWILPSSYTYTP